MIPVLYEKAFALFNKGNVSESLRVIHAILEVMEPDVSLLDLQALCHMRLGHYELAISYWQQALKIKPDYAELHNNVGILLKNMKRYQEAETAYRKAISLKPEFSDASYNLGNLLKELRRYPEAEMAYRRVLEIHNDDAGIYINLGILLQEMKRDDEAETAYRQALRIKPDSAKANNNLGVLLKSLKRYQEAAATYRSALKFLPENVEVLNNYGNLLREMKCYEEAKAVYQQALRRSPEYAEALNGFGNLLHELKRERDAEDYYRHAIAVRPAFVEAWDNLGNLLYRLKRYEEAEAAYREALRLNPQDGSALEGVYHINRILCQWDAMKEYERAIIDAMDKGIAISPFTLLSLPHDEGLHHRKASFHFFQDSVGNFLKYPPLVHPNQHHNRDRLRIGYLSADFHDHATAHLLVGILEAHERKRYEIYGYSYGPPRSDSYRQRIVAGCDFFQDLFFCPDDESARKIAEDNIDILIDLKGYTHLARPGIMVMRPAPILINWLGYPGTMGHSRVADYLIGDATVSPPHHAGHFSETLALLPHCYQPNDRNRALVTGMTRHDVGLPEKAFVFCCFNQSYKLGPESFDHWCRLLQAVPDAILWLLAAPPAANGNLQREATLRGIDSRRIIFAPTLPLERHLGRLALADLALDTFPVTSHTSGSDALWAGVPMITKMGNSFASRVAASLLHAVGLPELVTESWDSYFELALNLAQDTNRYQSIRRQLAANRLTHPLFDTERFTRDLEKLYERIWQDHGHGKKEMIIL
ncbi:MAG: tetratricopeptide repeat protein [Magnetococcales bacterium]|nr:tetratricopeptide repeat protein [Magnetococcales bacterium]